MSDAQTKFAGSAFAGRRSIGSISLRGACLITSALVAFSASAPMAFAGDVVWDGSANILWGTPANWDTNAEPVVTDDVKISTALVDNQPTVAALSVATAKSVALSVGKLTVRGKLDAPVTVTGGTLQIDNLGPGNVGEITGKVTNTSGTVDNYGKLAVVDNASTFTNHGQGTTGAVSNSGTFDNLGVVDSLSNTAGTFTNKSGGAITTTVDVSGGTFDNQLNGTVTGTTTITGTGTVTNEGSLAAVDNAGAFTNNSGGTTGLVTNSGTADNSGTVDSVVNNTGGTFTNKTGGVVTTTVDVQGGTFKSESGSSVDGTLTVGASGTVLASGGSLKGTVDNSGDFTVSGTVTGDDSAFNNLGTGTLTVTSTGAYSGLDVVTNSSTNTDGITIDAGGSLTSTSLQNDAGSFVTLNGTYTGAATNDGTFAMGDGSTLDGTLTNTGSLNVTGAASITGDVSSAGTVDLTKDHGVTDTLTLGGDLSGNGTYKLDIDLANRTSDQIIATSGKADGTYTFAFNKVASGLGADVVFFKVDPTQGGNASFDKATVTGLTTVGTVTDYVFVDADGNFAVGSEANPAIAGLASNLSLTQLVLSNIVNRPTSPFVRTNTLDERVCRSGGFARAIGGQATVNGYSQTEGSSDRQASQVSATYGGGQISYDYGCYDGRYNGWTLVFGGNLGMNQGNSDQDVFALNPDGTPDTTIPALGTIATDFKQTYAGVYMTGRKGKVTGDIQLRYDSMKYSFSEAFTDPANSLGINDQSSSTHALTIGSRVSYSINLDPEHGLSLIPSGGFSYTKGTGGSVVFTNGDKISTLTMGDQESLVMIAGATLNKVIESNDDAVNKTMFVSANIYDDVMGDRTSTFTDADGNTQSLNSAGLGSFGELSLGYSYIRDLSGVAGKPSNLFINLRADARSGASVSNAYSLTAQVRLTF